MLDRRRRSCGGFGQISNALRQKDAIDRRIKVPWGELGDGDITDTMQHRQYYRGICKSLETMKTMDMNRINIEHCNKRWCICSPMRLNPTLARGGE